MVHVPEDTIVTDEPLTVHTPMVWLENVTANPDDDVADIATVDDGLKVWLAGVPKVIVWLALDTVKACVTEGAAFHDVLPSWKAVMEHVPAAFIEAVVPLTVQMPVELLTYRTARPEVAVAESVKDVLKVRVPGFENEIDWLDFGGVPPHELEMRVQDEPAVDPK